MATKIVPEALIGQKFGKLTIEAVSTECNPKRTATVRCECGIRKTVGLYVIQKGSTVSCGCLRADSNRFPLVKHGEGRRGHHTTEYQIWRAMLQRCNNPKNQAYGRYGGRGVRVCESWHDYLTFLADVGRRPSKSHSLDRYPNNDGNYEPGNVRWADPIEQGSNKRNNRWLTINGSRKTLSQWARASGISVGTIIDRLTAGWPEERAVTEVSFVGKNQFT